MALSVVGVGYGAGAEVLYRPLPGGPATHPLTALAIALLGLAALLWRPAHREWRPVWPALAALALSFVRLVDIGLDSRLLDPVTPFSEWLDAQALAGTPIATGANTALMVALAALAMLCNVARRFVAAQMLAFVAIGLPLISLTGYAYGIERFYGRMSLATVLVALPVCGAVLLASAHRGFLRSVLSPWVGGRIARVQVLLGYFVPFLIGWALLRGDRASAELFGLLIVLVSAFISCLITYSAMIQETVDRGRRAAERRLALAATRDPLTDLPNRRLFFDQGPRELDRGARGKMPTSALMIDIDHFKALNDRYGHAAGDRVLHHVAELIRGELRRQDLPARYGGEEFVVLLPDTAASGSARLAEKLRSRIAAEPLLLATGESLVVTVSIGCAEDDGRGGFHALIEAADAALYRAKALGRNRVEPALAG